MNQQDRHNLFSELLARHHNQLYAYIFAVVKNRSDAEDVFQSVCLVLWRKFDVFQPDSSFFAWARETARLVLYSFLRHKKKLSNFANEDLVDSLAQTVSEAQSDGRELHLAALRRCRAKLDATDEELLQLRYVEDLAIREMADRLGRLPPNICKSLNRIRRRLLECVRMELARQERSGGGRHE